MLFRTAFLEGDPQALRLLAHRFFLREPAFTEIAILDRQGKERFRASRISAITVEDLAQRPLSAIVERLRPREVAWESVMTSDTSEPWVSLVTPLERSETAVVGVFAVC